MAQTTGGWFDTVPWGWPFEMAPNPTFSAGGTTPCGHCGAFHAGPCPRVKAVEYYPDGTVKRVEYHAPSPIHVDLP